MRACRSALSLVTVLSLLHLAAPGSHDPSKFLIVLRANCLEHDRRIYSESNWQTYVSRSNDPMLVNRSYRLLDYNETCGAESSETITRRAVSTLAEGGSVISLGWPGAEACAAMSALVQALSRTRAGLVPLVCAVPRARAAVLAHLVHRLQLSTALLLYTGTLHDCTFELQQIERALLGVHVRVQRVLFDSLTIYMEEVHVIIICNNDLNSKTLKILQGHNVNLLVILQDFENKTSRNKVLFKRSLDNVTSDLDPYYERTPPSSSQLGSYSKRGNISHKASESKHFQSFSNLTGNIQQTKHLHVHNLDNIHVAEDEIEPKLLVGKFTLQLEYNDYNNNISVPDIVEAIRYYNDGNNTMNYRFDLYETKLIENISMWVRVAKFVTTTRVVLDHAEGWQTNVVTDDETMFNVWCNELSAMITGLDSSRAQVEATGSSKALCILAAVVLALAALAITVFTLRRALAKRMQRRPRAAVILQVADFLFPTDEQHRLGEGMETMLTWLQQLHEFSGPELEQPDLLKRPVVPSAPSSTCSATRLQQEATHSRTLYKGDPVHVKYLAASSLDLKKKSIDILLVMQALRHENLNPFIGCLCELRAGLVFEVCSRGSLEDVLVADDIRLEWAFRLSLLTDLVRGMRYLHASPLRHHGRLSSRNCLVDARWLLRITDYGVPAFSHMLNLPRPPRSPRELLWSAPELLREGELCQGTQAGDVFSFAIIMQEVIVRGEPYCMLSLTPEEIIEKLMRPPPLIRPSVSMGAAPPEAINVMRECWSEQPDLRPDFNRLYEIFRLLHRGRKINIVDSMFEMLEKYSNNLEELIKERTDQLDMEKKKTEQLLNRMLPRSVAERLMLGMRVEPEEFEEVSIYFSDIVGFTALAARSTPVQVVDLLNDLYTTFDAAIQQYRVYKVETIGDAYMVVGGLPIRCSDHAESVATMALHLLHLAGRFRVRHAPTTPLHLRIGLHTGPCCAGVVGLTMPRFCLFGDTVNTASRMESTGAAWRIQVSSATAERLSAAGGFRLRSRGLTQVKGKGAMHTYWLLGKDGFDKPLPTPPPLQSEEVLFETEYENENIEIIEDIDQLHLVDSSTRTITTPSIERQRSDPTTTNKLVERIESTDRPRVSGAVSAESSPPPAPPARYRFLRTSLSTATVATLAALDTPRLGDRSWNTCGSRVLRRQWSLERGDVLAAAAAAVAEGPERVSEPLTPLDSLEPLALCAAPPPPRAPPPRYRTRPALVAPVTPPDNTDY